MGCRPQCYAPIGTPEKNPRCKWVANEKASWLDYLKSCFGSESLDVRMSKPFILFTLSCAQKTIDKILPFGACAMTNGKVYWVTGLSGAGKTTLCRELAAH